MWLGVGKGVGKGGNEEVSEMCWSVGLRGCLGINEGD